MNKFLAVLVLMFSGMSCAKNYTLQLSEHKRLEVVISSDLMNRLTVVNDRIANVFGDEGTFVTQADENTGQIFIKPTVENGVKPLSITIITENGVTQDLLLKPESPDASTIILKGSVSKPEPHPSFQHLATGTSLSEQEQIVKVMKQGVNGGLPEHLENPTIRKSTKEYKINYVNSYKAEPFNITVWRVQNLMKDKLQLNEKMFYKPTDLALSLTKTELEPKEQVLLYIVSKHG